MCRAHAERAIKVANGQARPLQPPCTVHLPGGLVRTILDCSLSSCHSRMPLWLAHNAEPVRLCIMAPALKLQDSNQPLRVPDQVVGGRTIAVDWAVPKAQFQSASAADTTGALLTLLRRPGSPLRQRQDTRTAVVLHPGLCHAASRLTGHLSCCCRQGRRQTASASRSGQRVRDWRRGRHVRC